MMIRAIIESASRDGNVCINICLRPDGARAPEFDDIDWDHLEDAFK